MYTTNLYPLMYLKKKSNIKDNINEHDIQYAINAFNIQRLTFNETT